MATPFLIGLRGLLESRSLKKLQISQSYRNNTVISIKKSMDKEHFLFEYRHAEVDETSKFTVEEIMSIIENYINEGYKHIQVETYNETVSYHNLGKKWKIERQLIGSDHSENFKPFDDRLIQKSEEIQKLLTELGITTKQGTVRQQQKDKLEQVRQFIEIFASAVKEAELLNKSQLTIWDTACGKSYLSFFLYYHLNKQMGLNTKFICVDMNEQLIERCKSIQTELQYDEMSFMAEKNYNLIRADNTYKIDVLYSLHGCNTATDEAIALGITKGAKLLIVAPCCQRELKEQMKRDSLHMLRGITKYPFLKERLADVITDALRSLLLEAAGYRVKILKFVPSEITPKNLMIIAFKVKKDNIADPLKDYEKIKRFFHLNPMLENLLSKGFNNN